MSIIRNPEAPAVTERILFVDDDARLLDGIRRRLRRSYALETAVGAERGLEVLAESQFAVVVADMNMPGMSGAAFLSRVKELYPDTVRMMLTGNADLGTAITAVNDGSVFRFITKPVANEDLQRFLDAGLEHRRQVAATRRLAAAEEASRAKSQFLATVSHELRTPLTVIRSSAEILEEFTEDEPAEVRAGFVKTISRFASHLEAMIDQLLHTAQLDAREHEPLGAESFDLIALTRAAIDHAVEVTRARCQAPRLTSDAASITYRGEPAELEKALVQLLVNACNVSPNEAAIEVVLSRADAELTIDVIDRGPGIPKSIAERVFEPFVQCPDVLTDKPPGLGLGLTIARRIVIRHGGGIGFHRDDQDRTHCVVTLPVGAAMEGEK